LYNKQVKICLKYQRALKRPFLLGNIHTAADSPEEILTGAALLKYKGGDKHKGIYIGKPEQPKRQTMGEVFHKNSKPFCVQAAGFYFLNKGESKWFRRTNTMASMG